MFQSITVFALLGTLVISGCTDILADLEISNQGHLGQQAKEYGLKVEDIHLSFQPSNYKGCGGGLPPCKNEPMDWTEVLTRDDPSIISGHETRTYTSADQLFNETQRAFVASGVSTEASTRFAQTIAKRFSDSIEFDTSNALVYFRMMGGPQYDTPHLHKTEGGITMCIRPTQSEISGQTLLTIVKVFSAPKDAVV